MKLRRQALACVSSFSLPCVISYASLSTPWRCCSRSDSKPGGCCPVSWSWWLRMDVLCRGCGVETVQQILYGVVLTFGVNFTVMTADRDFPSLLAVTRRPTISCPASVDRVNWLPSIQRKSIRPRTPRPWRGGECMELASEGRHGGWCVVAVPFSTWRGVRRIRKVAGGAVSFTVNPRLPISRSFLRPRSIILQSEEYHLGMFLLILLCVLILGDVI